MTLNSTDSEGANQVEPSVSEVTNQAEPSGADDTKQAEPSRSEDTNQVEPSGAQVIPKKEPLSQPIPVSKAGAKISGKVIAAVAVVLMLGIGGLVLQSSSSS